ncbi:MAG: hypothetical protein JW860_10180 [Sedimentisphaerales bacterium]|nr:hypothetical protein [Sedimentisphaerales bacterium]
MNTGYLNGDGTLFSMPGMPGRRSGVLDRRASGFSLMEVLFALMVLTLGLVFVASQFPLGLYNTRRIAETTINAIDSNNAREMIELQIGAIDRDLSPSLSYIGTDPSKSYIINDGWVHLLRQPNIRPEIPGQDGYNMLMDDPGGEYFYDGKMPEKILKFNQSGFPGVGELPRFYSVDEDDYLARINFGALVSPPVDQSDPRIYDYFKASNYKYYDVNFDSTNETKLFYKHLGEAIYEVAMTRNQCWRALYRYVGGHEYNIYIFNFDWKNKYARYAVQTINGFNNSQPIPEDRQQDRLFPVPWRIDLTTTYEVKGIGKRFHDRFAVPPLLADILRPGSVIIDGDPFAGSTSDNGALYEVLEVTPDDKSSNYIVRVRPDLWNPMRYFWVFPPAVERQENGAFIGFAETQPVIGVTQTKVSF